jgi:head-tail adaptor
VGHRQENKIEVKRTKLTYKVLDRTTLNWEDWRDIHADLFRGTKVSIDKLVKTSGVFVSVKLL